MRRPSDLEYGVLALLSIALTEHAAAGLLGSPSVSLEAALVGDRFAMVGLIAAFAMLMHFALLCGGVERTRRIAIPVYGLALAYEILDAAGLLHEKAGLQDVRLVVTGVDVVYRGARLTGLGVSAYALGGLAVAVALVVLARAYLAGKREALPVVLGTTVLFATVVNDIGVTAGMLGTGFLANAGFVAFVLGASSTYSARLVATSVALDRRSKELTSRTHELRKSYEELRAAQEELVRKEQLAVVGELAAVIAHEVRNPLAIIANAVAGLRKPSIPREDHETLLTILDEETSRLNSLVSDLLRYARPVNVQRSHISLGNLMERTLLPLRAHHAQVTVEFEDAPGGSHIWGDTNLLRQVFENLVDNAVQAMNESGALAVRLRPDTLEGREGLAVDIVDTGEGMDTMVRSRAKDPFFTTRPSGTGLGLAIVDRIVEAHGGQLLISSHAGEGTTVTVFLPISSSNEPAPIPRSRRQGSDPAPARVETSTVEPEAAGAGTEVKT